MTMSKGLVSYIEDKVSELKVMCGLSLDSPACEERSIKAVKPDPIPASKFMTVYRQRKRSGQLAVEFKALQRNQDEHSTTSALRNVLQNNKQDVLPYDHSRVILLTPDEASDYYNASYIDGYNVPKEYIASQGPSTKNTSQFWHMIWQENVSCIVMATGLFENAMQQCDKYWVDHARNVAVYGGIKVWHENSTNLAQLNIRTFRLQKVGGVETRVLYQYEMVGLHEECLDSGLLLDVRRRVNSLSQTTPGTVLVHCRCGGGRTAVYIALDYCLYQLQAEDRVDVYSAVLHLRRFRKNMVKTATQYQQIYHAIAMYIQCGVTVYPSETLPSAYQLHYASGRDGKGYKLDREFQTLQSIVPRLSIGDCASGHRVENRSKSRDIMMLPPECARPYLNTADCGESGTDFINAVYVDGYHTLNRYLVTQWPMKRTIPDIWRLLFDFKITSLVLMNDLKKFSRSYPRFWPKEVEHVMGYGPISVRYISCDRRPGLIIRTFAIRKPKRHPHLIAQALVRISEDVMILNNLVGCELRRDEIIVKMFQVLGIHSSSIRRGRTTNNATTTAPHLSTISNGSDGGVGGVMGGWSRGRCVGRRRRRRRRRDSRSQTPEHTADSSVDGLSDSNDGTTSRGSNRKCKLRRGVQVQSKSLLAVMEHVEEWQQRNLSRQPVCVMSKNGSSEAGLFTTISICCDQLKAEKEVDVFNAVRYVRSNRPQLIPTQDEYRFIYQFMADLIKLTKSKPDIIVSKPFPAVFTPSDADTAQYLTQNSISSSIHGGVYVTKLEDNKSMGSNSGGLSLSPTFKNCENSDNIASIPTRNEKHFEINPIDANTSPKNAVCKANSYPLNALSSSSILSSACHNQPSLDATPYATTVTTAVPSSSHYNYNANNSSHVVVDISTSNSNNNRNNLDIPPPYIHTSSNSPHDDVAPDLVPNNFGKPPGLNISHNSTNGYLLSPNFYTGNDKENHLNSSSSLCKSASFYSCDSSLSENENDAPNFNTIHDPNFKPFDHSDNRIHANGDLCSKADSYSSLKDFPTEDTSVSIQLECENSHSNTTSCLSIADSFNDTITHTLTPDLVKEKNNNCRKTDSGGKICSGITKNDLVKSKNDQKKSKGDQWPSSILKAFGLKKK